jgi:hypothetical protein
VHPLLVKRAKAGDDVYLETVLPVNIGGDLAIPPGTFVQGRIEGIKRSGWLNRKLDLQMRLTTLIFANGYTVNVPGGLDAPPGTEGVNYTHDGAVPATAAAVALPVAGSLAGVAAGGVRAAAIGGGIGAVASAAILLTMLAHDRNAFISDATPITMILESPVTLDRDRVQDAWRALPVGYGVRNGYGAANGYPAAASTGNTTWGVCHTPDIPGTSPIPGTDYACSN